jgi:hypothetical protein
MGLLGWKEVRRGKVGGRREDGERDVRLVVGGVIDIGVLVVLDEELACCQGEDLSLLRARQYDVVCDRDIMLHTMTRMSLGGDPVATSH